ncbi:DNA polymerase III subunit gamma/tau [Lebetimonas natsushimae]|uniref:DNA polymerase III subunit gamma/tau n=1 Tax=Lebetimonas natsushimae TaxID=1936991 RepID=A0A292YB77_9BACT|nr:DNA polymerase III subunit gamma/tau [Lebetimonas natsushimae]GAX87018.1 DNA polymerase III subunit gamma/tau [Lebetimonas natsushimae]
MVLALKFRPKRFEEVIGQDAIIKTLTNSLDNNRLAHAYLFSGLRGSGKTSTARIFAKALQCDHGPTSNPCEACENCIMANENRHIDIIEMDAASNRKIEDIRELIEHTKYKPTYGRYKIFIIDEVHMLTNEAFNALLKTLEEPPEYVKFIMATTDPLKLPATILSRVQHFRFNKINEKLIENYLIKILTIENVEFENEALRLLIKSAKGSIRDSLTLLDQAIAYSRGHIDTESVVEMLGIINPEIISKIFEAVLKEDKKEVKNLVNQIKDYDIEAILDEVILYVKDAVFNSSLPLVTAGRFLNIISDARELIKYNTDNEFVLLLMFFRMIEAIKPHKIDDLIAQIEQKIDVKAYKPKVEVKEDLFKKLIKKIKERDIDLGVCFETSVKFISFENGVITWESCPDENCNNMFKRFYSPVIRPLINEIFGIGTKVDVIRCQKKNELKNEVKPLQKKEVKNIFSKSDDVINKVREIFGSDVKITKINHQ